MRELVIVVGVLAVLAVSVAFLMPSRVENGHRSARTKSKDNVRTMITMMISRATETESAWKSAWPGYSGKNFILSLVATGQLDRRNPRNLGILFPPRMRAQFEALDLSEYEKVTLDSLKTQRFPHLTGYVGRRNLDPEFVLNEKWLKLGTPLVADLSDPDGIVIGWTNGSSRFMSWEALEMEPPDGPVVVGAEAQHPLLRMLSDE